MQDLETFHSRPQVSKESNYHSKNESSFKASFIQVPNMDQQESPPKIDVLESSKRDERITVFEKIQLDD